MRHPYPENPGWKDATVSKDNAVKARPVFNRMQALVLRLYHSGFIGTPDEAAERLGITPFSARPRCTELYKMGHLARLRKDKSPTGFSAWVLGIAEEPPHDDDGQPDELQEWHDYDPDC
jgi:hypothetical protein